MFVAAIALIGTRSHLVMHVHLHRVRGVGVHEGHPAPFVELDGRGISMSSSAGWSSWLVGYRDPSRQRSPGSCRTRDGERPAVGVSRQHEPRAADPLNAISVSRTCSGASGRPDDERQAEYIEDIRGSGQHLLALIDDVLDLAKVEAGGPSSTSGPSSWRRRWVRAAALFRELAGRHRITIDAAFDTGVGVIWPTNAR